MDVSSIGFFTALIAGILTILAPCVLPLLPIIVGGSVRDSDGGKSWRRPLIITTSLVVSVLLFTLLIRASTAVFDVSDQTLKQISGGIIIAFGLFMAFPKLWDQLSLKTGLGNASNRWLSKASGKKGVLGDVLIGAALGPVFTSCSPTYGLILATVLPASTAQGIYLMVVYSIGLAVTLLTVAILGGKFISKIGWATDPNSKFRRILGILFLLTGVAIIGGYDKDFESWLIQQGLYDWIVDLERKL